MKTLIGKKASYDFFDPATCKIFLRKGQEITPQVLEKLEVLGVNHPSIVVGDADIDNQKREVEQTISLSLDIRLNNILALFDGMTEEQQIINAIKDGLLNKLRVCNEEISTFEAKYGMYFSQFEDALNKNKLLKMNPSEVEEDYKGWRALELDKKKQIIMSLAEIIRLSNDKVR